MHRKADNLRFGDLYGRPGDWCGIWKSKKVCFGMMGELHIKSRSKCRSNIGMIDDMTHNATYPTHFKGL